MAEDDGRDGLIAGLGTVYAPPDPICKAAPGGDGHRGQLNIAADVAEGEDSGGRRFRVIVDLHMAAGKLRGEAVRERDEKLDACLLLHDTAV